MERAIMCAVQAVLGRIVSLCLLILLSGCSTGGEESHPLEAELARSSLRQAMQAWVDGRSPKELLPEIVVGDPDWEQGRRLDAFEILLTQETTDGSNLHIPVKRRFDNSESIVTYIVGTSPVVSIFPQ